MHDVARSAIVALALFLVVGTVLSELTLPLVAGDGAQDGAAAQPVVPPAEMLLTAMVHHVIRHPFNETGEEVCKSIRTFSDPIAPVLLLDHTRTDACEPYEEIEVYAEIDTDAPGTLTRYDIAACRATTFSTTERTDAGVRLTSLEAGPCERPGVIRFGDAGWPGFLRMMAYPHELAEPGLWVVCAAAEIAYDGGPTVVLQDMAWFEVWPSLKDYPGRTAVRESLDANTSCRSQGIDWRPELRAFHEAGPEPLLIVRSAEGP